MNTKEIKTELEAVEAVEAVEATDYKVSYTAHKQNTINNAKHIIGFDTTLNNMLDVILDTNSKTLRGYREFNGITDLNNRLTFIKLVGETEKEQLEILDKHSNKFNKIVKELQKPLKTIKLNAKLVLDMRFKKVERNENKLDLLYTFEKLLNAKDGTPSIYKASDFITKGIKTPLYSKKELIELNQLKSDGIEFDYDASSLNKKLTEHIAVNNETLKEFEENQKRVLAEEIQKRQVQEGIKKALEAKEATKPSL